jgi:hypothetical protein
MQAKQLGELICLVEYSISITQFKFGLFAREDGKFVSA